MVGIDRRALLARSWTEVARPYLHTFAPRFAPWTDTTLHALADARPPPGASALVPACGPGQELPLLAAALPAASAILGVDLAEGMVAEARRQVAQAGLSAGRVRVEAGDACDLSWVIDQGSGLQPVGAIVSCFGLQQMPNQAAVLAAWTRLLMPGGVLAVCYWPRSVEETGPWQRLFDLTADTAARNAADWEADIPGAALREGAELLVDTYPVHTMRWPSVEAFWEGMVQAGPWHSRLLLDGPEEMERLRRRFMEAYPDPTAPLEHAPRARLVVLRRRAPQAAL
eukprot:scaffold10.g2454.t1